MTNESGFFLDSLVGASKIQQDEADRIKPDICANYPDLADLTEMVDMSQWPLSKR